MSSSPLVTIVTPTKNRRVLLGETMDSVQRQTFDAWEHIIVDDGSDDGTAEEVCRRIATDSRVRFLPRSGTRAGANICRNQGLAAASADLIVFLDSDDLLRPGCLRLRADVMDRNRDLDFAVFRAGVFIQSVGDFRLLYHDQAPGDDLLRYARRFLAIGRMVPQKAPIILLEAFRLAAQQDPDLTLDYVGDGELFPAVSQFVHACDLYGRVRLHGLASDEVKNRLLHECGVFVQHSALDPETGDEESLPASIQEAMAHGLAVVSTRHAGIPEAVRDGETGLLVDEGDAKAMAAAFLDIPAKAAAYGDAGYLVAAKDYRWTHEKQRLQTWLGL